MQHHLGTPISPANNERLIYCMNPMAQILGRGLEPYEVNTTGLTTVTCECDHKITTDNKYYKSLYVGFGAFL